MQEQRQLCSITIKCSQRIFINLSAFVSMFILETLKNVLNDIADFTLRPYRNNFLEFKIGNNNNSNRFFAFHFDY